MLVYIMHTAGSLKYKYWKCEFFIKCTMWVLLIGCTYLVGEISKDINQTKNLLDKNNE